MQNNQLVEDMYNHQIFAIKSLDFRNRSGTIYSEQGAYLGKYDYIIPGNKLLSLINPIKFAMAHPYPYKIENSNGQIVLLIDPVGPGNPTFFVYDEDRYLIGKIKEKVYAFKSGESFEIEINNEKFEAKSEAFIGGLNIPNILSMSNAKVPINNKTLSSIFVPNIFEIKHDLSTDLGKMGLAISLIYSMVRGRN